MTKEQQFLIDNNGKTVKIEGLQYKVTTTVNQAIYPYKHTSVRTCLDAVNKKTANYIETKKQLHDEWSISYDQSDIELQISVLSQLGYNFN